jgi:indole-3-glycerol phosphate synthase
LILDTILEHKRAEVAARKATTPRAELEARVKDAPHALDFAGALKRGANGLPAVIAEVKKASPSKGLIRPDFDPEAIARAYENAGAAAVSVLTDKAFFEGSLEYLTLVKNTVSLPVLRKDFIIVRYQLLEARAAGADAALLIVAALDAESLRTLMAEANEIGLQCLVEVHDEREMDIALGVGASVIGINNRNLQTFEVSLDTTGRLLRNADCGMRNAKTVSESGISTREDMVRLGKTGVDAVLIGEALMRERDIEAKLRELIG